MMAAGAADLFLFLGSIMEHGIVQSTPLTIATQTRIVAFAKAVEISLCRLTLQTAVVLESTDGDVSVVRAAAQGLIHCLGVVHLAVTNAALLSAKTFATAVGILDELFGGDELYAAIHYVAPCHFFRISMLAYELQLGGQ